jgi:hypothetical protein
MDVPKWQVASLSERVEQDFGEKENVVKKSQSSWIENATIDLVLRISCGYCSISQLENGRGVTTSSLRKAECVAIL